MALTSEQKNHAKELIETGDKLEAVRYLQQALGIDAAQALLLAEKLEEETENHETAEFSELKQKLNEFRQKSMLKQGADVGRIVGSVFMVIGSIMLIVVVYIIYSNYRFSQRAIPVTGEVISYDSHESSNDDGGSNTMYTPTYGYSYNGKNYTYTSSTSSSSQDYDIGEKVEVLVDPDDPEEVLVNAFWERWFVVVILGFMGSMFTGLGYMAYRLLGKRSM